MTNKANAPAGSSAAGLRGVAAASSSISDVNGEKGELIYQGYNIHDLARHSTFEEVVFLLWNKQLPSRSELSELEKSLRQEYGLPAEIISLMKQFPREADPIDVLRTVVSAMEFYDSDSRDLSREATLRTAVKLTAQFPTIVAAGGPHTQWARTHRSRLFVKHCCQLSLHVEGRKALRAGRPDIRYLPDTSCRSRIKRIDIYGASGSRNFG